VNQFPSDPEWPTVTVVSRPGDLEPRWRDDAAVVGGAVFAAMRPDRLIPAWIVLWFLWFLGWFGHAAGIGDRMLPGNPAEAWERWQAGLPLIADSEANNAAGGLLHGVLLAAGGFVLILLWATLVRLDAERLGRDRDIPVVAGLRWAVISWRRLVGAVLLPPVLAFLLALPAMGFGLLTRIPGLDVVVAAFWIVPLVPAFAGALIAVAWVCGLPFIVPAAACEDGDPVETTIRVAGLLRRRFPRAVVMLLVAVVSGVVGWMLVAGVAATTIGLASVGLGHAAWPVSWPALESIPRPHPRGLDPTIAAGMIQWWFDVVVSLAHAWAFAFVLLACGRVLLVIRRVADRLPFDDLGESSPG
jgi:hypothetical protein